MISGRVGEAVSSSEQELLRMGRNCRAPPATPRLGARLGLVADSPHDFNGASDLRLAQVGAHRRRNRQEPRAQLPVARLTFAREANELGSLVLWVVEKFH